MPPNFIRKQVVNNRLEGYDFIRSVVILVVFLGHVLGKQATNEAVLLAIHSVSPGLTMSLLGFISAILLSSKDYDFGTFLVKRFTRIYISLFLCLGVVLTAHFCIGKNVLTQHALLHFMGLSAFFDLLLVQNKATIGTGLWFVTAIVLMYLIFPFLQKLFRHKHGLFHLVSLIVSCTIAGFVMYGTTSIWNVVISFSVGAYLGSNGYASMFAGAGITRPLLGALGLFVIVILSSSGFLPHSVRGLLYAFGPSGISVGAIKLNEDRDQVRHRKSR